MANYIEVYLAENDEPVSREGDMTNPISVGLRTDLEEEDEVRLYLKCEAGLQLRDIVIEPEGDTFDMWSLAPDDEGSPGQYGPWGEELEEAQVDEEERFYFWARARAEQGEDLRRDTSVTVKVEGLVEPV